jgi:hypothetical protein
MEKCLVAKRKKKRGEIADTAFSRWWGKSGDTIATTLRENNTPPYQVMKIAFYWGWMARGVRDKRAQTVGGD